MPIGQPFLQLTEVDSSNNYAMGQVQAHLAEHGNTWFVHNQTAGRGQRGKSWNMAPGENIIMTTVIAPTGLRISESFQLSIAVALACHDLFAGYAMSDTAIKWPNDLYWRDRKAGGILIENVLQGFDWKYAIVGIGININQTVFPPHIPNPVSLKQITGKTFDPVKLAQELCMHLEHRWQQVVNGEAENLLKEYNSVLYKLNKKIRLKRENAVMEATVAGVNMEGELLLNAGTELAIHHGQWEWLIDKA